MRPRPLIAAIVVPVLFAGLASAQLAWWGTPIPKRDKPPVVFVTGHDALCPDARAGELPFFEMTFGHFDKVMAADGRVSLVFESCFAPGRPPIEEIANVLRKLMGYLAYDTGEPVSEVDMVAHSMGGLTVRAYLAGKQADGTFTPPSAPRVRKLVFIGTPHFGTHVATATDTDPQVRQMSFGHPFLFDLATWNQGTDDLRGIDALSIAGTAGKNGIATDSVVSVASASIDFAMPGRTITLPYCHTQGGIGQLFLCEAAPGLARVSDADHPTARVVLSFLNGTDAWRTQSSSMPQMSGILVQSRSADDTPRPIAAAQIIYDGGPTVALEVSSAGLAFSQTLRPGPARLMVDGVSKRVVLPAGGSRAVVVKPGPFIETVEPAPGPVRPAVLAAGMRVAIRGTELNAAAAELNGTPVQVLSAIADRIDVVLPENVTGLAWLTVRTAAGRHSVRVLIADSAPVFFQRDGAVAEANAGEIVSLFLTGLGVAPPEVTVGQSRCDVLYVGHSPVWPGVDQINCRLPAELPHGMVGVEVRSGSGSARGKLRLR